MARDNRSIARAWGCGQRATSHTGNFSTDGKKLYSYNLCIGDTASDGTKVLRDHTAGGNHRFYSVTTSRHVGMAAPYADIID